MASTRAKSMMRDDALKRMTRFFGLIAERENLTPPVIQVFRDKEYQEAIQLKNIADFGEALAISMGLHEPEPEPESIVETTEPVVMTFEEPPIPLDREHLAFTPLAKLIGIARERNIDLDPKWTSQDVMEAIIATVEPPPDVDIPFADGIEDDDSTTDEGSEFGDMTVAELKEYAAENNIDLEGATKKADIIAAIEAAESVG